MLDTKTKQTKTDCTTFIKNKDLDDIQQTTYQRTSNNLTTPPPPPPPPPLTKGEINSLHKFRKRDDIIVTKADKGGAVVLINDDDYMKEAKRQLDNTEFYTKPNVNPSAIHNDIVNKTIHDFAKDKLLPGHIAKAIRRLRVLRTERRLSWRRCCF